MNPLDSSVEPIRASSAARFRETFAVRRVPRYGHFAIQLTTLTQNSFVSWLQANTIAIDADHFGSDSSAGEGRLQMAS